jgi:predicted RNase H-like HicB family nuclease
MKLTVIIRYTNDKPYSVHTKEFGQEIFAYVGIKTTEAECIKRIKSAINDHLAVNAAEHDMIVANSHEDKISSKTITLDLN